MRPLESRPARQDRAPRFSIGLPARCRSGVVRALIVVTARTQQPWQRAVTGNLRLPLPVPSCSGKRRRSARKVLAPCEQVTQVFHVRDELEFRIAGGQRLRIDESLEHHRIVHSPFQQLPRSSASPRSRAPQRIGFCRVLLGLTGGCQSMLCDDGGSKCSGGLAATAFFLALPRR